MGNFLPKSLNLLVCSLALAGLAAVGLWSARAGWADWLASRNTADSLQDAVRWIPLQADYHFRLGVLTGDRGPFERAAALNPLDAATWMELGLRSEAAGDTAVAERYLLRAAQVDRQYLPRWTLANFYFRRQNLEQFWTWAAAAADRVYGDATTLFRLCGAVTEDGELIRRLPITRPDLRLQYLLYLMQANRMDVAAPAIRGVLESHRDIDVPLVLVACDRLIDEKQSDAAIAIWNRLAAEHRIPFSPVNASSPGVINADFATPPTSHGFDWRLPVYPGITPSRDSNPLALRLGFSGEQPEACELLSQFVPVREDSPYRLTFFYRTAGLPSQTGLRWYVHDAETGAPLAEGPELAGSGDRSGVLPFRTPHGCRMVRLVLRYGRAPGTTRITGDLVLRKVVLSP